MNVRNIFLLILFLSLSVFGNAQDTLKAVGPTPTLEGQIRVTNMETGEPVPHIVIVSGECNAKNAGSRGNFTLWNTNTNSLHYNSCFTDTMGLELGDAHNQFHTDFAPGSGIRNELIGAAFFPNTSDSLANLMLVDLAVPGIHTLEVLLPNDFYLNSVSSWDSWRYGPKFLLKFGTPDFFLTAPVLFDSLIAWTDDPVAALALFELAPIFVLPSQEAYLRINADAWNFKSWEVRFDPAIGRRVLIVPFDQNSSGIGTRQGWMYWDVIGRRTKFYLDHPTKIRAASNDPYSVMGRVTHEKFPVLGSDSSLVLKHKFDSLQRPPQEFQTGRLYVGRYVQSTEEYIDWFDLMTLPIIRDSLTPDVGMPGIYKQIQNAWMNGGTGRYAPDSREYNCLTFVTNNGSPLQSIVYEVSFFTDPNGSIFELDTIFEFRQEQNGLYTSNLLRDNATPVADSMGMWLSTRTGPDVWHWQQYNNDGTAKYCRARDSLLLSTAPLPIKLMYFNAHEIDGELAVLLDWKAYEKNAENYLIERSADGIEWETIETVTAFGDGLQAYQLVDENPLIGTSYYRIIGVDAYGTEEISDVRAVTINFDLSEINLFPNPNDGSFTVSIPGFEGEIQYRITSVLGQDVSGGVLRQEISDIDVNNMVTGNYFLQVISAKQTKTLKFTVEN
jgi:hypothetical protein